MPAAAALPGIDVLRRMYADERRGLRDISAAFGVGQDRLIRLFREHGIARRAPGSRRATADERFRAKYTVTESGCWQWTAGRHPEGYGQFYDGVDMRAYVWSYRRFKGLIPAGYEVDHLCRNRACVNPSHLEAVTKRENTLRGESPAANHARATHCLKGHPLSGDNLDKSSRQRQCRACRLDRRRATRKASRGGA